MITNFSKRVEGERVSIRFSNIARPAKCKKRYQSLTQSLKEKKFALPAITRWSEQSICLTLQGASLLGNIGIRPKKSNGTKKSTPTTTRYVRELNLYPPSKKI